MPIPEVLQMQAFRDLGGRGAFGAYIDSDNATCWLFQYQAGGFARCSMSDGSVIFQGNIFGDSTTVLDYHADATPVWAQSGSFYYSVYHEVIYKLQLGASPLNSFGNGYLQTVATIDLTGLGGSVVIEGWAITSTTLLLADSDGQRLIALDTSANAILGVYAPGDGSTPLAAPFIDQFGVFWAVFAKPDKSANFVPWNPADGATGGVLNVNVTNVASVTLGTGAHGVKFATYAPGSHSVMLGNLVSMYTGQMTVISLTDFHRITFAEDNGQYLCSMPYDAPESAFQNGCIPNGTIAMPGDIPNGKQVGGIHNVFDPNTLEKLKTYNVTADILEEGFTVPVAVQPGRGSRAIATPFANMRYNQQLDRLLVTYQYQGSPAYSVKVGIIPIPGRSLGLMDVRNYCQAFGIFISGSMDQQRPAADWLNDLCDIGNCAPVWNGLQLNFIPRCEQSMIDNGATFTAPTSSGPLADLDDSVFIGKNGPPVIITRTRPADAYNILPIEHLNRADNYNHTITTIRDQGDILARGPIKANPKVLLWIQDQPTAIKVAWPLLRRQTLINRLAFAFTLPLSYCWLDPMDLVTITDIFCKLLGFPVRLVSTKETDLLELECTAEPFYFGAHVPTPQLPSSIPINTSFNQSAAPGSVNVPIIFEPVARLNEFQNQASLWIIVSGSDPNYGGNNVWMSTDGGATYGPSPVGTMNGNPIMGTVFSAPYPASPDPDATNHLFVDLGESAGVLQSFTTAQRDAFTPLCYIENGGAITVNGQNFLIPYEIVSYATANLISGNQYDITPTIRRGVFSTPSTFSHPVGSKFAFLDKNAVVQVKLDPALIGKTLFFKFTAFNQFASQEQGLPDVTAYSFTPTGQVGGSQLQNQQNAQGYTTTPAQLVFQGRAGGWPGQPTWTDPTKIYIVSPFTVNFASGPVQYSPASPQVIPGVPPEIIYVSIQDPSHTGSGTLFVDTTSTRFNTNGFTKVGQLFINDISTGGANSQVQGQRNIYTVLPVPDGVATAFLIQNGIPPGPYVDAYVNGILQTPGVNYTLTGNQVNFTSPPKGASTNVPADLIEIVF